jgi:hypothetical protein
VSRLKWEEQISETAENCEIFPSQEKVSGVSALQQLKSYGTSNIRKEKILLAKCKT